jgi:hypothetical protein
LETADLTAGVLLLVVLVAPVALEVVVLLEVDGLVAGLGLEELIDPAGLRVVVLEEGAPRFSARLSGFAGDPWAGARDVLLGAPANGFFSSPPIELWDLWLALEDVGAVALVGFRTEEVGTERTGGLLNPPVVRVDDDAVGLVAPGATDGRFAARTPARLGGTFSYRN